LELKNSINSELKGIYRWGTAACAAVAVCIVLFFTCLSFPDALQGRVTLTALNPPVLILSRNSGKISHLLVNNNQRVLPGSILAVIENTADYQQVIQLEILCDSILRDADLRELTPPFHFPDSRCLGELTPYFLPVVKTLCELKHFVKQNAQPRETQILYEQLNSYARLQQSNRCQEQFTQEELVLAEKDFSRDSILYKNQVLSDREFESKQKDFLQAQRNLSNQELSLTTCKITVLNIEKNILDLQLQADQERHRLKSELKQNLRTLQSAILSWKQNYLLQSPIEGSVSFYRFWAPNQCIKAGEQAFNIRPAGKTQLVVKVFLPVQNSGKAKPGQKVLISLDNYPAAEYGSLRGRITSISALPENNSYLLDVALAEGLKTGFGKTLPYHEEMSGSAQIITGNTSLMKRLFNL